jgi:hypothetical protein
MRKHKSLHYRQVVCELDSVKAHYAVVVANYKAGVLDSEIAGYQLSDLEQKLDFLEVRLAMMLEQV